MKAKHLLFVLMAALGLVAIPENLEASWTIQQITDNNTFDSDPSISGSSIVWRGWSGSYYNIFRYDAGTTVNLTNYPAHEDSPDINGTRVVWYRSWEIYCYDGVTVQRITNNTTYDQTPAVSDSKVVWVGNDGGGDTEIFLRDLSAGTTTQLTVNGVDDRKPRISGDKVVWWQGLGGPNDQVMLYDGTSTYQITPIGSTFHNGGGRSPDISGDYVVYVGNDGGNDDDIFLYDISTGLTTQLTNTTYTEITPRISGSGVVWTGVTPGSDYEIFYHDLLTDETWQLTDNDGLEQRWPQISGTHIAWRGFDGVDYEIYSTTVPEPATLGLLLMGGLVLLRRRSSQI